MQINTALKNTFGFGGINVSLCFKRYWYNYKKLIKFNQLYMQEILLTMEFIKSSY